MATISRTGSVESDTSATQTANGLADSDNPPSPTISEDRLSSHSLLSVSSISAVHRKSRFADAGTIGGSVERASISMPPPANKSTASKYNAGQTRQHAKTLQAIDGTSKGAMSDQVSSDSSAMEILQKTTSSTPSHVSAPEISLSDSAEATLKAPQANSSWPGDRLSISSLYSLGSAVIGGVTGAVSPQQSTASSHAGSMKSSVELQPPAIPPPALSPSMGPARSEATAAATTATDPVLVTANSDPVHQAPVPAKEPLPDEPSAASKHIDSWNAVPPNRPSAPRRSRSKHTGHTVTSTTASSAVSPSGSDRAQTPVGKVGVCALDIKARSKASRNILTRLSSAGEFEVVIFGDKVILDEAVENWPKCDFLISFFSDGFPLDKAIAYNNLRKPFVVNDLPMQKILWDRRLCLRVLDSIGVPTPQRVEVNRDGGPVLESPKLAEHLRRFSGVKLEGPEDGTGGGLKRNQQVTMTENGDAITVDGISLRKPFVEKPISGEDHNIHIYFPKDINGGGGRRLFRKIGNKSSEWDDSLKIPRAITEPESSYLYEKFLDVDNAEDIKAYTVGPNFCHAETRTSPVVDGLVRRNTHGKEIRYICNLKPDEQTIASKITTGFGQRICGFDMLRVKNQSFVIDVNGWSFVKDNNDYYDKCAKILKDMFTIEKRKRDGTYKQPELEAKTEQPSNDRAEPEKQQAHRKPTIGSHRSDFVKKIMKTPSMSKLRNHSHGAASPEPSTGATPLSSPPTLENEPRMNLKNLPPVEPQVLPSPLIPTDPLFPDPIENLHPPEEPSANAPEPSLKHSWKLKGLVAVVRHADRTPKQKLKFTFHTQPFVDLLKGHQEEVLLKGEHALKGVEEAARVALQEKIEDPEKLRSLQTSLARKGAWTGTKVQIKPMFRKRKPDEIQRIKTEIAENVDPEIVKAAEALRIQSKEDEESGNLSPKSHSRADSMAGTTLSRFSAAENEMVIDKLQLIVKWGGEPTHSARYQSQDLGENMRGDMMLMNKEALENVHVFSSSERRVTTSAQIWMATFLNRKEVDVSEIKIRKDLLDDSNAAKDVMDVVKKKLKLLLREGHKAPPQFAWPANTPEPSVVVRQVAELMTFHRQVMRDNFKRLEISASAALKALRETSEQDLASEKNGSKHPPPPQTLASIQSRWCCGENPELFKERWEKLFTEFCDSEKVDPSKISELYDTMKFDALHNRPFLEWVFTPPLSTTSSKEDQKPPATASPEPKSLHSSRGPTRHHHERKNSAGESSLDRLNDRAPHNPNLAQRIGLRRKSVLNQSQPSPPIAEDHQESYFKLFSGTGQTRLKQDAQLEKLRELYKLAKVLFDFICPQEYGISNEEKLEIGLLTSLPLLKEIVHDLEEVQASEDAKSFVYFTKESHIYTLLNCILEGGIKTKIERNAIPELDYLSNITFELYEAEDKDADVYSYSIRIGITPGCHTFDPLDVQLDSKHSIGCAPRRSLTSHIPWTEVIETLRAKFHTVKLPKSFLAVNVSEG